VFILYALPVGLAIGLLARGRLAGIASIQLRWGWLMVAALWAQVLLFSTPVGDALGAVGPLAYVVSTGAVLAAILANLRTPGLVLVAAGALSNLVAIVANGGHMPASAAAYTAQGRALPAGFTNAALLEHPVVPFLGDVIPLPTWLPMTNVISVGDVLIAAGIASAIAVSMWRARTRTPMTSALPG
jgi:uncharacterized protein DUF5317